MNAINDTLNTLSREAEYTKKQICDGLVAMSHMINEALEEAQAGVIPANGFIARCSLPRDIDALAAKYAAMSRTIELMRRAAAEDAKAPAPVKATEGQKAKADGMRITARQLDLLKDLSAKPATIDDLYVSYRPTLRTLFKLGLAEADEEGCWTPTTIGQLVIERERR